MQALSIAISTLGIEFFAQEFVATKANAQLKKLTVPNSTFRVPVFFHQGVFLYYFYLDIKIALSDGKFEKYNPQYQSISQLTTGIMPGSEFNLVFAATNFTVGYSWYETYKKKSPLGTSSESGSYAYNPQFGSLTVSPKLQFTYEKTSNTYAIVVVDSPSSTANVIANIPAKSVINEQTYDGCFKSKVSDTTAKSISDINFSGEINKIFPPVLSSIPASGNLTSDITYDFSLGDSGLNFPNSKGITIGVTGAVMYKGTEYDGTPPTNFPVPPVPTTHHLNAYVSNYQVNALNWAFWKDGKLNVTVEPADLPNPDALKAKTYVSWLKSLKPYEANYMQAQVSPKASPLTAFQDAFVFTDAVLNVLKSQLPSTVYQSVSNAVGQEAFVSKTALESELKSSGIAETYFATIEKAALQGGIAVTQDMQFKIVIQTTTTPQPNIIFDVTRTDVLVNLALGISGTAQTLQFGILNVENSVTYVSSTVPNFNGPTFGGLVWPVVGESAYRTAMVGLGKTGVPIPIMQGFKFLFDEAELSVQQGFVSILADVELLS